LCQMLEQSKIKATRMNRAGARMRSQMIPKKAAKTSPDQGKPGCLSVVAGACRRCRKIVRGILPWLRVRQIVSHVNDSFLAFAVACRGWPVSLYHKVECNAEAIRRSPTLMMKNWRSKLFLMAFVVGAIGVAAAGQERQVSGQRAPLLGADLIFSD